MENATFNTVTAPTVKKLFDALKRTDKEQVMNTRFLYLLQSTSILEDKVIKYEYLKKQMPIFQSHIL